MYIYIYSTPSLMETYGNFQSSEAGEAGEDPRQVRGDKLVELSSSYTDGWLVVYLWIIHG